MNSNEDIGNYAAEDVIVLGVASVETQGLIRGDEGVGGDAMLGISED